MSRTVSAELLETVFMLASPRRTEGSLLECRSASDCSRRTPNTDPLVCMGHPPRTAVAAPGKSSFRPQDLAHQARPGTALPDARTLASRSIRHCHAARNSHLE